MYGMSTHGIESMVLTPLSEYVSAHTLWSIALRKANIQVTKLVNYIPTYLRFTPSASTNPDVQPAPLLLISA